MYRYKRAANLGIVALQKLEAYGFLPQTEMVTPYVPSKLDPKLDNQVIKIITRGLIDRDDVECLEWLHEGGYNINLKSLKKYADQIPTSTNSRNWINGMMKKSQIPEKIWVAKC